MSENKETPPVCSYEGSDYQESFWEQGGRAYEDAVEAIALKRLLPPAGKLMLELGAGAGRNTLRYANFERVVLLDYSRTQLEQARKKLGDSKRYIYAAADVYQLPFVTGLFDAATMIRTLHHMAEPQMALQSVGRVLAKGAVFILEFANKRNLKAVMRYMLRRQDWNPFSREAVEFAELNFDFHPKAIRQWLQEADFCIDRQLSVSHLRVGFLKRYMPLGLMVALDAALQWTGALAQYSPSVFTRAQMHGEAPDIAPGTFFRCPACGEGLPEKQTDLTCPSCGSVWEYRDGIYDFRL